jgi:hypothetical protein
MVIPHLYVQKGNVPLDVLEKDKDLILIVLVLFLLLGGVAIGDIGGGDNNDLCLPAN